MGDVVWSDQEAAAKQIIFFTSVTPLSKFLAFILFITLPFVGFYLGIKYQKSVTPTYVPEGLTVQPSSVSPTLSPVPGWKMYRNEFIGLSMGYPGDWNSAKWPSRYVIDSTALSPAPVESLDMGFQVQAVVVSVVDNPKHLTSREYFDQVIRPSQEGSTCTEFLINSNVPDSLKNQDATIIEGLCGIMFEGPRLLVGKSGYMVSISSGFIDKVDSDLIYQMFSTIEFDN